MKDFRSQSRVTLEDLLRLKRAEKPDAAFWTQFEEDFRAKQLAAAVAPRRWWFALPQMLPRMVRYSLPIGATAVLAFTFVTLRQDQDGAVQPALELDATVARPAVAEAAVAPATVQMDSQLPVPEAVRVMVATYEPAANATSVEDAGPSALSNRVPWTGETRRTISADVLSPSARLIAANMVAAEAEFTQMLHRRSSEARVVEEPLSQITVPSVARSSRVLPPQMAQLASYSAENERSSQVTERQARYLSEDQFYDMGRRLSAQADRLNLKL